MHGKSPTHQNTASRYLGDIALLTLGIGIFYFLFLGVRPLFVPDEGRYAEIAREMVTRHDFITPYLNSIKYFEKPPFFYWMGALAIKLGGVNLWALRSINAIIAIIGCVSTYTTARILYGRVTGIVSTIVLSTSMLYFVMAHMISLDLPVTVFIAISLYCFLLASRIPTMWLCRTLLYTAASSAALAVLTKGLIGIVLPGLIVALWMTITGKWQLLKKLPVISSLVIFFLIATPWHYLVNHYNPEFFHFYFIEQHILRYTDKSIGHYQPAWFFIPVLMLGLFPWIVFLPQAIATSLPRAWRTRHEYQSELFFICWAVVVFIFFSFSKSKLIPYILPVIPPLAILLGKYLARFKASSGTKIGYGVMALCSISIACFLWRVESNTPFPDPDKAMAYLRLASSCLVIGSVISMLLSFKRPQQSFIITSLTAAIFLLTSYSAVPYIDSRTIRPLATTLNTLIKPQDRVITYNQYYQDLPFYLQRRVSILNWQNELSYGMAHQDTKNWMINDKEFARLWSGKKRVYMIMSKDEYRGFSKKYPTAKIFIIDETGTNLLVTNLPLAFSPS